MSDFDEFLTEEIRSFDIEYADGTTAEVGIIAQFEVNFEEYDTRQEYIVVAELEDGKFSEDELEVMPYRFYPDPLNPDSFRLGDVESDEEKEIVMAVFDNIMNEEDEGNTLYS